MAAVKPYVGPWKTNAAGAIVRGASSGRTSSAHPNVQGPALQDRGGVIKSLRYRGWEPAKPTMRQVIVETGIPALVAHGITWVPAWCSHILGLSPHLGQPKMMQLLRAAHVDLVLRAALMTVYEDALEKPLLSTHAFSGQAGAAARSAVARYAVSVFTERIVVHTCECAKTHTEEEWGKLRAHQRVFGSRWKDDYVDTRICGACFAVMRRPESPWYMPRGASR